MEQTKLSVFCDKIMEAGWLLAAVFAPLFFDVYSSRVFEPDKITLIRSLAVIMSAAWLIKLLEGGICVRPALPGGATAEDASRRPWYASMATRDPLAIPIAFLVAAYLVSTLFSVSQVVSIWGSYQRLQGTYSTFSYVVIAALLMSTMRRRDQVERLITMMLFTSLPAALYGLVQNNRLEFLPWAGDVTTRVTSTMGNAIFIAAWLIMVVPLALGRYLDAFLQLWSDSATAAGTDKTAQPGALTGRTWAILASMQGVALFVAVFMGLRLYSASLKLSTDVGSLDAGLLVLALGMIIVPLFLGVRERWPLVLGAAAYLFLMLTQLATIWFSGSRGPLLGLMAGLVVFAFMFTLLRRLRRTFYAAVVAAVVGMAFLAMFNIPGTPLEPLKQIPYVGRLGSFLDTEGGTGKVRVLIWEGAIDLIKADPVRTLIGWGPESMYVAYNQYYPPDLAHYEARNASPDRSHNETYDSLVITGVLGFFAYWAVFYTFFYFALDQLGLVRSEHRRALYIALLASGAVAFLLLYAQVLPLWASPALPLLGVVVLAGYLVAFVQGLFKSPPAGRRLGTYQGLILAIFAGVLAHFIEIQFGIAIASSRTYFWLYLGLTVVIARLIALETGAVRPQASSPPEAAPATAAAVAMETAAAPRVAIDTKRKTRKQRLAARDAAPQAAAPASPLAAVANWWPVVTYALMAAAVLVTMVFDFVVPQQQGTPPIVLALIFGSWLFVCVLSLMAARAQFRAGQASETLFQAFLVCSLVTWLLVVIFAMLHPVRFASATSNLDPSQFISYFYVWAGILVLALALALFLSERRLPARAWQGIVVGWAYPLVAAAAIVLVVSTNLNVIVADIYYKNGDAYDKAGRWDLSVPAYQQALRLAPSQDFYYLFLGRAYMELAKRVQDAQRTPATYTVNDLMTITAAQIQRMSRQDMLNASLTALIEARKLNPLNTDHTANLGRLYRFWGEIGDAKMLDKSLEYYRQATEISPNTAHIYDEWALVYYVKGQYQEALLKLQKSASLDALYAPTFVYLGDTYQALNQPAEALAAHVKAVKLDASALTNPSYFSRQDAQFFDTRLTYYEQSGMLDDLAQAYGEVASKDPKSFAAHYTLGYIYFLDNKQDDAVRELQQAVAINKDDVASHSILGYIYAQQGRIQEAVQENQEVVRLAPNDLNSHRNLAVLYQRLGMTTQAIAEVQTALKISPNDATLQDLLKQLQALQNPQLPAQPTPTPAPLPTPRP